MIDTGLLALFICFILLNDALNRQNTMTVVNHPAGVLEVWLEGCVSVGVSWRTTAANGIWGK